MNVGLITISLPNVPTRARSPGSSREELLAPRPEQRQVALHAAADVEHDDDPDGLRRVVEDRQGLGAPVVEHLKVVAGQSRDEPVVFIGDGDEDRHAVADPAKDGRLLAAALRVQHAGGE